MEYRNKFHYELWLSKAKDLYNIQQQRKQLEKVEKELSDQLKILQFHKPLVFGGMRYYFEERKGNINYQNISQLRDVDLEQYREPSVKVWKLAVDSLE